MTYQIEKGIPIPKSVHSNRRRYPLEDLAVNDSFAAEIDKAKSIRSRIQAYGRSTGKVFKTRQLGDVIRVWRVA